MANRDTLVDELVSIHELNAGALYPAFIVHQYKQAQFFVSFITQTFLQVKQLQIFGIEGRDFVQHMLWAYIRAAYGAIIVPAVFVRVCAGEFAAIFGVEFRFTMVACDKTGALGQ